MLNKILKYAIKLNLIIYILFFYFTLLTGIDQIFTANVWYRYIITLVFTGTYLLFVIPIGIFINQLINDMFNFNKRND